MRWTRSFGPVAIVACMSLLPMTAALGENAEFEGSAIDGSQLEPAGAEPYAAKPNDLNSVPEDRASSRRATPESTFVKQIIAARPNEDLVICIAGCASGRDRVVYAQPAIRPAVSMQSTDDAALKRSAAAEPASPMILNHAN